MYSVCKLRLSPNFGMPLTAEKNSYLRLTVEKMHIMRLRFSWENICGHTDVPTAMLPRRLIVQIKKLK